jgi:hypothetical protein
MNWNRKIVVHSVPRSGSTWLGSIFDSSPNTCYRYQPLFSFSHKGYLNTHSSKKEIDTFFDDIFNTTDEFVLQKEAIEKGLVPQFKKEELSHIIYKEVRYHYILENLLKKDNDVRLIGLVRSPFAVLNSWIHAPKEFRRDLGWNEMAEWRYAPQKNQNRPEEFNGYDKWKEVLFLFKRLRIEFSEQVFILNYEALLSNPATIVKQLFEFCNLPFTDQTESYLKKDRKNIMDAYSVFKNKKKDDQWKTSLHPEIIKAIKIDLADNNIDEYL